jgi:ribosome-associated protein
MSKKSSSFPVIPAHDLARQLARLIDDKKGQSITVFDLRGLSPITDFFVIAEGLSELHNRAIADHLAACERPNHIEGRESGTWVLLDYIDVIVHIFSPESRRFFGLERLWGDAPQIDLTHDH